MGCWAGKRRSSPSSRSVQRPPSSGGLIISPRRASPVLRAGVFQQSLLQLLLALDAMPRPGYGFQPLGVDLLSTGDALTEGPFANTVERAVHHLQELALIVALGKQKFLVIGIGRPISDVLCRFQIGVTPVLSCAIHSVAQFSLAVLQA